MVIDAAGREYPPLEVDGGEGSPVTGFSRTLGPDTAYSEGFLFDLPNDIERPALWVTDDFWLNRWIPGHENSFLHPKTVFSLEGAR